MTPYQRKSRVDELFNKIALMAQIYESDPSKRDELIKPMVEELWAVTQQQEKLHKLDYKRVGCGDAYEDINE